MKLMYLKLVFFLVFVAQTTLASGYNAPIPFKLVNGLIVVEAQVGEASGEFILDTGSEGVIIHGNQTTGDTNFETLSGALTASLTGTQAIKLGSFTTDPKSAYLANLNKIKSWLNIDLKGILGGKAFAPNVIIIDYQNHFIQIKESISTDDINGMHRVDIKTEGNVLLCEVKVNKQAHYFILDSGATAHYADVSLCLEQPFDYELTDEKVSTITANGIRRDNNVISAKRSTLGNLPLHSNRFVLNDFSSLNTNFKTKLMGLLSLHRISDGKVIIDQRDKKLYFD